MPSKEALEIAEQWTRDKMDPDRILLDTIADMIRSRTEADNAK